MMIVVLLVLSWIALIDARTHRIPNRQVFILSIASFFAASMGEYSFQDHLVATLIVLLFAGLLSIFCGLGPGDVKLLGVLAMFVLPARASTYKIFLFTIAITAMVHAIFLSRGNLRKSLQIPLAPAILCGTIAALFAK
jgi:Flp pilus assembly protein protease CpaA